jgi:hypothetical protein
MPVHFLLVFLIVSFLEDTLLLNQCGQQQRDNYRTFTTMNFLDKSTKALTFARRMRVFFTTKHQSKEK